MDSSPAGSVNKSIAQDTLTAAKSAPGKFRVDQGRSGFPSGPAQSPDDGVVRMNTGTSSAAMATDEGRVRTYACFIAWECCRCQSGFGTPG
jgi:hypothetical protein